MAFRSVAQESSRSHRPLRWRRQSCFHSLLLLFVPSHLRSSAQEIAIPDRVGDNTRPILMHPRRALRKDASFFPHIRNERALSHSKSSKSLSKSGKSKHGKSKAGTEKSLQYFEGEFLRGSKASKGLSEMGKSLKSTKGKGEKSYFDSNDVNLWMMNRKSFKSQKGKSPKSYEKFMDDDGEELYLESSKDSSTSANEHVNESLDGSYNSYEEINNPMKDVEHNVSVTSPPSVVKTPRNATLDSKKGLDSNSSISTNEDESFDIDSAIVMPSTSEINSSYTNDSVRIFSNVNQTVLSIEQEALKTMTQAEAVNDESEEAFE